MFEKVTSNTPKTGSNTVNISGNNLVPFNPFENVPPGWNPALPPPIIQPVQGVPLSPASFQYPGATYGAPWDDIQELIRKQKKTLGILAVCNVGTVNNFSIKLSGTANIFLGLAIGNFSAFLNPLSNLTLTINNDVVIDKISTFFLLKETTVCNSPYEYKSYPRPLSGNDDIVLTINEDPGGLNSVYEIIFYYL